ncbi:Hypothetical protein A7982_01830 [Minicystis rosea]|nr:Hypothetical protein A7982_01830 [Minicystis rosea]
MGHVLNLASSIVNRVTSRGCHGVRGAPLCDNRSVRDIT